MPALIGGPNPPSGPNPPGGPSEPNNNGNHPDKGVTHTRTNDDENEKATVTSTDDLRRLGVRPSNPMNLTRICHPTIPEDIPPVSPEPLSKEFTNEYIPS
jgi:hypothetical protein